MYRATLLFVTFGLVTPWAAAQDTAPPPPADAAATIRQIVETYVAAFNQGDAEALASSWSEDAVFVAPSGEKFEGRRAIREGFDQFFLENKGARLEVNIADIRVDGADAAEETGSSRLTLPNRPPEETNYVARYRRIDGSWKLVDVRERDKAPSHYEQLKSLEWMIGEWGEPGEGESVRTACRWTKNKNFISRSFAVKFEGQDDLEGTQVIGWDPDKQVIRSWLFDSDGGFAVGLWSQKENQWKITSLHVMHDGRKASSVNILRYVDENTFTWESTSRDVDGELLPNIGPVTIVRRTGDE